MFYSTCDIVFHMRELSKSIPRRLSDPYFSNQYFVGSGIDIGGLPDPLTLYSEVFPKMTNVRIWDWNDGDAQFMEGVPANSVDFVHSSHCLEHLENPIDGLKSWFRIVKPGGHLITTVPEEDLYEQGTFPSTFNQDHKWTFTIHKEMSWSSKSINVLQLLLSLGQEAEILLLRKLDLHNLYGVQRFDQTRSPVTESCIEFVVRKRLTREIEEGGRLPGVKIPDKETLPYLNQYRSDQKTLMAGNKQTPPFQNSDFSAE